MSEAILYCLRLGVVGFGGPMALIAMMQKELVVEKKWMDEKEFANALPMIKAMPGPVAWQSLLYILRARLGPWKAIVPALFFILPSAIMMILLAHFYEAYRAVPVISMILDGMQAAAYVLILFAIKTLGQNHYRENFFGVYFILALVLFYLKISEPIIILGMGTLGLLSVYSQKKKLSVALPLFWICFKAGALAFGTGLTIVPLLESDFVKQMQWITHQQFMDALAFGQMTPGPVTISVAFIGYKVLGIGGAIIAVLGVFMPSSIHILTWFPKFVEWLSTQQWVDDFLTGAVAALIAGIVFVMFPVAMLATKKQILIFAVICFIQYKIEPPSWILVLMGGAGALMLRSFQF